MSINLRKILIRDIQYNWANYSNSHTLSAAREVNMIDSKDYDIFKKNFKKRTFDKLDPEDKVFFTVYSKFPRHKFREAYKNAFVKKIENATAIIINPDNMFTRYVYSHTYYELSDKTYIAGNNWHSYLGTLTYTGNSIAGYGNNIPDAEYEFIKNLRDDQKLISDKDFLKGINKDCADLDDDNIESIRDLLRSKNKEDVKTGMNIISTLNYGEYGYKIAYLLGHVKDNLRNVGYTPSVASGYIMESLDKEYHWRNYSDLEFAKVLMNSGSDEQKEFSTIIVNNHLKEKRGNSNFLVTYRIK